MGGRRVRRAAALVVPVEHLTDVLRPQSVRNPRDQGRGVMAELVQAQVLAAGVSYFSVTPVMDPAGNPRKDRKTGDDLVTEMRHEAMHGDVVEMSQHEFERLAEMNAVRTPSSAPTRPALSATPFGVPLPNAEGVNQAFVGPVMGHPAPSAGASDLEISRATVAGALTPEESARLQQEALVGKNDDSAEAIQDRDYEAATVPALKAEIDRRNSTRNPEDQITPEGTGSNGNVIKDDLEMALTADDEERDTE